MKKVTKKEKPSNNASLGKRIEYARTKIGLSQEDLASKVNRSRVQITQYETDARGIDNMALKDIAVTLNVSVDYLLGLTDFESLDVENKAINERLGLSDDVIDNLSLFNVCEKGNGCIPEINKVYILNQLLESKVFIDGITTNISKAFEELKLHELLEITNLTGKKTITKSKFNKEVNFAMFQAQNTLVETVNKMSLNLMTKLGVEIVEDIAEDDYE